MSRTYQATGINLKGIPLGETDRLLTVLTPEYGLVRAVAPGARKHKSHLRGRSELFVINELLLVKGRSLDKITQAETRASYPGLSKDLGKLAAGQYLAELVLCLSLSEQPQTEIYELLIEHLTRLETLSPTTQNLSPLLAHLSQSILHILVLAGIGPQLQNCCVTNQVLEPNFREPNWYVGFSIEAGGLVNLALAEKPQLNRRLNAQELFLLQQLPLPVLDSHSLTPPWADAWSSIERLLRDYFHYHCGKTIRSAALIDALCTPNL